MNLIMSVVKPGEGAWYSVDNRVTRGRHEQGQRRTQAGLLRCRDGAGALLYTAIDFTDIASGLAQRLRLVQEGRGPGDPIFDALTSAQQGAVNRGIRPWP